MRIRLIGVQGQRLLVSGLKGPWTASIVLQGDAGPELAGDMDAPGICVICLGSVADGAGRGIKSGRLEVLGNAGDALGYEQSGGVITVAGSAGHRAGLRQSGGEIHVAGNVGRLAADRQSGGTFFYGPGAVGPYLGHGRTGGLVVNITAAKNDLLSK